MASSTRPPRDPISQSGGINGGGSPKRADLLNGQPRTKSISNGGPAFTSGNDVKSGFPVPNSPYGGR